MFEVSFVETANALVDEYAGREPIVPDVDEEVIAAVRGLVALRAVADDLLARVTDQAARIGVARRSGMTLRELLCVNGVAPSVASRLIRLGAAREVLPGSLGTAVTGRCQLNISTLSRVGSPMSSDAPAK